MSLDLEAIKAWVRGIEYEAEWGQYCDDPDIAKEWLDRAAQISATVTEVESLRSRLAAANERAESLEQNRLRVRRFLKADDWAAMNERRAALIHRQVHANDLDAAETAELACLQLVVDVLIGVADPMDHGEAEKRTDEAMTEVISGLAVKLAAANEAKGQAERERDAIADVAEQLIPHWKIDIMGNDRYYVESGGVAFAASSLKAAIRKVAGLDQTS